jgi:hypothetical protein
MPGCSIKWIGQRGNMPYLLGKVNDPRDRTSSAAARAWEDRTDSSTSNCASRTQWRRRAYCQSRRPATESAYFVLPLPAGD